MGKIPSADLITAFSSDGVGSARRPRFLRDRATSPGTHSAPRPDRGLESVQHDPGTSKATATKEKVSNSKGKRRTSNKATRTAALSFEDPVGHVLDELSRCIRSPSVGLRSPGTPLHLLLTARLIDLTKNKKHSPSRLDPAPYALQTGPDVESFASHLCTLLSWHWRTGNLLAHEICLHLCTFSLSAVVYWMPKPFVCNHCTFSLRAAVYRMQCLFCCHRCTFSLRVAASLDADVLVAIVFRWTAVIVLLGALDSSVLGIRLVPAALVLCVHWQQSLR